ncbi:MAG: O-antigen ligase family protein [Armatimonadota bacterium]
MSAHLKRLALIIIIALLPLLPVLAGKTWPWQNLLVIMVVALALTLWGIGEVLERRMAAPTWRPDAIDLALAIFVILQLVSWFPSVYRFASALYGAKVLAFAITFWLLRYGLKDRRLWRAALWCLMLGGLLLAIIGLQEYVRTVKFLGDANWRVFGPMFNPNVAAGYLLLTIFPAAALLFGAGSRSGEAKPAPTPAPSAVTSKPRKKSASKTQQKAPAVEPEAAPRYTEIAGFFSAALMFLTILLTGSKGAFAGLLFGIIAFALLAFKGGGKARLVRLGILGFVLFTIALAFLLPPLRQRLLSAFAWQSHSSIFRLYTWQATWDMIKASPWIGFGGGTFENILPRYAIAGFTRSAHQSFMQIAAECGIPALFAGLLWGVLLLRRLAARAAGAAEPLAGYVAAAAVAGLLASSAQQMADYAWYIPGVGLAFFALAALGLAGDAPTAAETRPLLKHARWLPLVVGITLLLWASAAQYAEVVAGRANSQIAAGNYRVAIDYLEQASRINPSQAQFPVQIAKLEEAMAARGDREPLQRAIQARQRATVLQPSEPVNYLALSRLYEQTGDLVAADKAIVQGLRWFPSYPRGLAQLAHLQEKSGKHEAALQTYRRLLDVYRSPVGRYPPVQDMVETAYVQAWIALGDASREHNNEVEAVTHYAEGARLLIRAISTEMGTSRQLAAAGEANWGHLEENQQTAAELLERLQKSDLPVSVKLMIELHKGLENQEDSQRLLRYLIDTIPRSASGRAARAWAMLQLAQDLEKDKQEEARALAKKGLLAAKTALDELSDTTAALEGWQQADTDALSRLVQWANSFANSPSERADGENNG